MAKRKLTEEERAAMLIKWLATARMALKAAIEAAPESSVEVYCRTRIQCLEQVQRELGFED